MTCITMARFTKYLTTFLRLSYDNAKVVIDLRRTLIYQKNYDYRKMRYGRPTIRNAILTCAQKPTSVGLIYHTDTTAKESGKQKNY